MRRSLALGEASRLLTTSVAAVRAAAVDLTGHLVAAGMVVVDDGMTVTLLPHRDFVDLADTALTADRIPRLREPHLEVLGIVLNAGRATRRRIDDMRGVDSAETIAHLVEWGLLQREGAEGRSPVYRGTARLVEVTGAASMDELSAMFHAHIGDARARAHSRTGGTS